MKTNYRIVEIFLSITMVICICSTTKNSIEGGIIGGTGGALIGAGIGVLACDKKGAAI